MAADSCLFNLISYDTPGISSIIVLHRYRRLGLEPSTLL